MRRSAAFKDLASSISRCCFPIYKEAAYSGVQPAVLHTFPLLRTKFLTFNVVRPPFTGHRWGGASLT